MKLKKNEISEVLVIKLEKGEDLLEALNSIVKRENVKAGFFTGIGGLNRVKIGAFISGKYEEITLEGQFEVVSLLGNISIKEGQPFIHAHITVSKKDGTSFGGHLLSGSVIYPMCEIFLIKLKEPIKRRFDEETQLYVLDL
ncbi:MAG: PPC domain-containing DNA-binding protein [Candidatus Baldrarchaeia archaeon]